MEREVQLREEEKEFQMQKMRMMVECTNFHNRRVVASIWQIMAHATTFIICIGPQEAMDNNYPCNED